MRTVDPELWYRKIRRSIPEVWLKKKTDANMETRLRSSFRDAFTEFWMHCSVKNTWFMNKISFTRFESYRVVFCATVTVFVSAAMLLYNWWEFDSRPLLQGSVRSWQHAVRHINFPAIAICSNNIISKTALKRYTNFLLSKEHNSTYSAEAIERNLLNFGALLMLSLPRVDFHFMQFLQRIQPDFNVTQLMFELSPKCSSLLGACAWRGLAIACSKLFAKRLTPLGYCCVFNSQYQQEDIDTPSKTVNQLGQSSGLIVRYSENDEDIAYVRRPAVGTEVLIFDGTEYPLLESGVTRLLPIQRNASMFFSISVRLQRASPHLRAYSENWRGCRFRRPDGPRGEFSSQSWCLMECRRRTAYALCNCLPYTLLPTPTDFVCTPDQLACLNKHKEKFMYYYPGEHVVDPGLSEEMQDSQECMNCIPDCARPSYSVHVFQTAYAFHYGNKLFRGLTAQNSNLVNTSVLRFFYSSNHQPMLVVEPTVRSFEVIVALCCQFVLVVNASAVTVLELVFHLTVRWAHHYQRRGERIRRRTIGVGTESHRMKTISY